MKFYDRERELKLLENLKGNFRLAIVGRRRIGKTRLIEEFYKERLTLFISAEKSEKEIISDWSKEYAAIPKVDTFRDLFEYLFSQKKETIFLDEIQNLLKVNKSFIFDLQRLIDKHSPRLIVSGSLIRAMKGLTESYRSPLFGRFDMTMKLRELSFRTVAEICRDLGIGFENAFKLYAVFGGVPKYYELLEKLRRFELEPFILEMFVHYPRPLYEEVRTMLREEFGKENRMFFSILSAVSQGNTRLSEIGGFVGTGQTKLTKYLHLLRHDFEILSRELPLIGGKRGIYRINSNLMSFWFANIWRYQELLEKGEEERLADILRQNLNSWLGRSFESIVMGLVKSEGILPFVATKIGRQWGSFLGKEGKEAYEIDILALNEKTNDILFGECKWEDNVDAGKILSALRGKAGLVEWRNRDRKESYAIFAKSFRERVKGKNVYCCSLKDMEAALQ